MLDYIDKRLIAALSDDLPLTAEPYTQIANQLGISPVEVVARLEKFRQTGILRKLGAVLSHHRLGYTANALVAGIASPLRLDDIGILLAQIPAVSHCYARRPQPNWPYNLYVMLHDQNREQCRLTAAQLMQSAGISQYQVLFSTKEWKKAAMVYKLTD